MKGTIHDGPARDAERGAARVARRHDRPHGAVLRRSRTHPTAAARGSQRLLRSRPPRAARARPGAAGARVHAVGDRGLHRSHPRRRDARRGGADRTLLAPWAPDLPESVTRTELQTRTGRALADDDIELLVAIGVVEPTPTDDVFQLAPAHLAIGIAFLELGLPTEAALTTRKIFTAHGRAIAEEMTEVFRTQVWPHLRESELSPEDMTAMIERFKPLTVQALVTSYEEAVDESSAPPCGSEARAPSSGRRSPS